MEASCQLSLQLSGKMSGFLLWPLWGQGAACVGLLEGCIPSEVCLAVIQLAKSWRSFRRREASRSPGVCWFSLVCFFVPFVYK